MWNYRTEPCLMGWQQGHKPAALPVPDEHSNCWEVDWEGKARCTDGQHPTQKPVRLFELPMLKHTRPGDICLETFAGSGSQVIAAERLDRRCFAVERMPRFCDVIVKRWELYTGQTAIRVPAEEERVMAYGRDIMLQAKALWISGAGTDAADRRAAGYQAARDDRRVAACRGLGDRARSTSRGSPTSGSPRPWPRLSPR